MSHTYTTQNGKTAVPVNPYKEVNSHRIFNEANPPIPLATERPDLIGKEFEGEVVWQYSDNGEDWAWENNKEDYSDFNDYEKVLKEDGFHTRQALSVPVKGEEKVDDNDQKAIDSWQYMEDLKAAFEAGEDFNNDCHCGNCSYCDDIKERDAPNFEQWYLERFGHWRNPDTHATNDANLVPLDKVEPVISKYFDSVSSIEDVSEADLITQIKNLTKE